MYIHINTFACKRQNITAEQIYTPGYTFNITANYIYLFIICIDFSFAKFGKFLLALTLLTVTNPFLY